VNFNVEPWIAKHWNVPVGVWVGAVTCIISLAAGIVLWFLDRRGEELAEKPSDVKVSEVLFFHCLLFFSIRLSVFVGERAHVTLGCAWLPW
jgi:hypothetical protein